MKKIRDTKKFLRSQRRKQRRTEKSKKRRKHHVGHGGGQPATRAIRTQRELIKTVVVAPKVFSLIENPEGTINFIESIKKADAPGVEIWLDLNETEEVTLDAVLLLVSQIKGRIVHRCRRIGGELPKNPRVREFLARSGFYSHFSRPPKSYDEKQNQGYIKRREGQKVREDVAQEVIHYANERLLGEAKPNKGVYRVLIECMANTRDHASVGQSKKENWWLAVYHDSEKKKVYFALLDNGIGLFESARLQSFLQTVRSAFGLYDRVELLLDMLDGKIESRTKIHYRGKGLPAIYTAMKRGFFSNLRIVSNNVVLNAEKREGRKFSPEFSGTCYFWEVTQ